MKTGLIYEKNSGRILMTVVAPDEEGVLLQKMGREDLEAIMDANSNGREFYIQNGAPVERPEMKLSIKGDVYLDVGEVLKVEDIPKGTEVIYPAGIATVDDGFIEWSAVEPGSYYFKFINFPMKEEEIHAIVR